MGHTLDELKQRLTTVHYLNTSNALLSWDQHTHMPPGGAENRAAQMSVLSRLSHELFTADETRTLLEEAANEVRDLPYDSDDASLVRVAKRDYDQLRKLPVELVAAVTEHAVRANEIWVQARQDDDFSLFAPSLEKTIDYSRQIAEHLGYEDRIYDPLLDQFEPGMKTSQVENIFADLKRELVPLVHALSERLDRVSTAPVHQPFDEVKQESFGRKVIQSLGFDFQRGRQDRSVHPFATGISRDDVRITTRFEPDFLNPALFGSMHETGHAMYEQGLDPALNGTLLADGASLGLHESQSRMWENVVGRSLGFWQHFYPSLQDTFPDQLQSVDLQDFYSAINTVAPSYIRVEADEVTYNLHIMLRFEMENDLLEGRYPVSEAPEVWNQKMEDYLGLRPPSDSLGILQDVHWSGGMMGYFPTYSLGNILSIQLYEAAVRDHPEIPREIATGEFTTLRNWLTEKVYRHGRKFEPNDIVERATGETIQSRAYINYLKTKYGAIYGLELATSR